MAESRRLRTQAERDADDHAWRATDPLADAAQAIGRVLAEHLPVIGQALADLPPPRRRWWHRYTRRNP